MPTLITAIRGAFNGPPHVVGQLVGLSNLCSVCLPATSFGRRAEEQILCPTALPLFACPDRLVSQSRASKHPFGLEVSEEPAAGFDLRRPVWLGSAEHGTFV
jgi:hypothetical protein